MGDTSRRTPKPRRCLAVLLASLCAFESGALPAAAAVGAPSEAPRPASGPSGFDVLSRAAAGAGWAPASALGEARVPSPPALPVRASEATALPALLVPGVLAGRLRSAGPALIAGALAARRADVAKWVAEGLEAPLAGLSDGSAVPLATLARIRENLPALLIAETPLWSPDGDLGIRQLALVAYCTQ